MLQPLPKFNEWKQAHRTLHLYLQIVGKIKLKVMPRRNHWWGITLFVNSKGITTDVMPCGEDGFEIQLNLIEHRLEVNTSRGESRSFNLAHGLSVAAFYKNIFSILKELNIEVKILNKPYSLPDDNPISTPFNQLEEYADYDPELTHRFWQVLLWVDQVMQEFSGRFYGKTCPVQIYWHHFDLTVTRFSGKKIPLSAGMGTSDKDAYSHEVISFGFWAGDDKVPGAAFYSYTYPSPKNLEAQPLEPSAATWQVNNGSAMAMLTYDDLLREANPKKALLAFFETAYRAGAALAGWNVQEMQVPALSEL